jgi:hypothetical protein
MMADIDGNGLRLLRAAQDGKSIQVNFGEPVAIEWGHHRLPIASLSIEGQADVSGDVARDLIFARKLLKMTAALERPLDCSIGLTEAGRAALTP